MIGMSHYKSNNERVSATKLLPDETRINQIALDTGLVKRISLKFSPFAFMMVCIQATAGELGTLEHLASELAKTTFNAMSRSGMFQRFHETTVHFFVSIFYETLCNKINSDTPLCQHSHFRRIIVEDSTQFKMNAKNSENFKAHGNAAGDTAGCKVDFTYDLLSKSVLQVSLHLATDQDKEIGKQTLDLIDSEDLILRKSITN